MASCSRLESPNWLELPRDVTANILQRLGAIEIVTSACHVCPLWWNICKDPFMWRTIHMSYNIFRNSPYNLENVCRYAVDRSCGQLEDIHILYFGSDDLLNYISDCMGQLRRLRLANYQNISDKGLRQVAMKLPLLEEFDIHVKNLSKDSIEAFGRCCPLLRVFKFNARITADVKIDNEIVIAIAKTMPKLRDLLISGLLLTEDGLLAILDGCPLLQSLDLEDCFSFGLMGGSLEKSLLGDDFIRALSEDAQDFDYMNFISVYVVFGNVDLSIGIALSDMCFF
ncbi:Leucine-rich repeat domain superfamily [Sesbania bispinosa]|nr:Leucine-rich repeat domain superfamily [Sesbania bispinosa]